MIIKGKSRKGPRQLGTYLDSPGENEHVEKLEIRGTIAQDIPGAIHEMDAYALGTRCEKPLYHAMINPEPPNRLSEAQCMEAVDALEEKLGLRGHSRVVVLHEKHGRQHLHVVWSRINTDEMKAVHLGHNYRKHEEVSRDLERRFGHGRVQGVHAEREGVARPDRTPSRAELRQEERTGISGKEVKRDVTEVFHASDTAEAFKAALEDRGYIFAQGDKRDFVIMDRKGGIHSLAKRIDGMKTKELREFMAPIARDSLPSVAHARELAEGREVGDGAKRESSLEKAYGRGDDYVSQSSAALKDNKQRQELLEKYYRDREGVERMKRLKERFDQTQRKIDTGENTQDGDPNRQTPAPGGGHTRSR